MINLLCYNSIVFTTYMLFVASPTASDLLLNVVALQFLIDVDDFCYQTVMGDSDKNRLKQKMLLCYIQNGEKSHEEAKKNMGTCRGIKDILSKVTKVAGFVAVAGFRLLSSAFCSCLLHGVV